MGDASVADEAASAISSIGEPHPSADPAARGGEADEADGDVPGGDAFADQGVEIEATPAGKATRRLSLLSGGEKALVALAFVFSIFLARPSPFYILDEVEAALDDANIDRFLSSSTVSPTAPSSSSSPTRSGRWTPPTSSTASRWATAGSPRSSHVASTARRPATSSATPSAPPSDGSGELDRRLTCARHGVGRTDRARVGRRVRARRRTSRGAAVASSACASRCARAARRSRPSSRRASSTASTRRPGSASRRR